MEHLAGLPSSGGISLHESQRHLAADAVLRQTGSENCLRGKLTNAMVTLSDSCDASGRHDALCRLADQVVMETSSLTMTVMEDTAQKLLRLTAGADR